MLRRLLPQLEEMLIGAVQHGIHFLPGGPDCGIILDIAAACVDKDHIRLKLFQLRVIEHDVFPVFSIFGSIERGFDILIQQEQLQHIHDFAGGGAAQHGNFLRQEGAAGLQQLLFQGTLLFQNIMGVKGILQFTNHLPASRFSFE